MALGDQKFERGAACQVWVDGMHGQEVICGVWAICSQDPVCHAHSRLGATLDQRLPRVLKLG